MVETVQTGSSDYSKLGDWMIQSTLGRGNVKVKLGVNLATGQEAALKIFKFTLEDGVYKFKKRVKSNGVLKMQDYSREEIIKELAQEAAIMEILQHPHIIKFYEFHESIDYIKRDGRKINAAAIVMEVAKRGELYDYFDPDGRFTEEMSRLFFKQILSALEYCHNNKIAHRDIKPSNFVFDENFNLKLIDFGFATFVTVTDGSTNLIKPVGSEGYMAPELILNEPYDGPEVDLFAAAVILFNMVTGAAPFEVASPSNSFCKALINRNYKKYWQLMDPEDEYSAEFKDFIQKMLSKDQKDRLSIEDIKAHPWYIGTAESPEIIKENLEKKFAVLLANKKKQEQLKVGQNQKNEISKKSEYTGLNNQTFRGREEEDLESKLENLKISYDNKVKRRMKNSCFLRSAASQFLCSLDPEIAFKRIILLANEQFDRFSVSPKEYKIKGSLSIDNMYIELAVILARVDDALICVEFQRISGDSMKFYEIIREKIRPALEIVEGF